MLISFAASSTSHEGAVAVGVLEGGVLTPSAEALDKATAGALKRALGSSRFTGKRGQILEILAPAGLRASRILLAGLKLELETETSRSRT